MTSCIVSKNCMHDAPQQCFQVANGPVDTFLLFSSCNRDFYHDIVKLKQEDITLLFQFVPLMFLPMTNDRS